MYSEWILDVNSAKYTLMFSQLKRKRCGIPILSSVPNHVEISRSCKHTRQGKPKIRVHVLCSAVRFVIWSKNKTAKKIE